MRPLYHEDFKLYQLDMSLYDELMERNVRAIKEAKTKFMGEGFTKIPLPTFKELNSKLDKILKLKMQWEKNFNYFDDQFDEEINYYTNELTSRNYTNFKDENAMSYKRAYENKEEAFYKSKIYRDLVEKLYEYNLDKYHTRLKELKNES